MNTAITRTRKDRLLQKRIHGPYKSPRKLPEPTVCPKCNAVFKAGRWQWLEAWPANAPEKTCPACRRIQDNCPAGSVILSGDFIKQHRQEVINLARHHEWSERSQHPLHRIISIEELPDQVVVATTDIHLPKRIGQAVLSAYKGQLDLQYDEEGCFVRIHWTSLAKPEQLQTEARQQ